MTPFLLCYTGTMLILEELDDGTAKYLMVTPLGKTGYLFSRIGMITVFSLLYNMAVMLIFSLSDIMWHTILVSAILNAVISTIVSMMVVSFAKNKVQGMALLKLSGFMILGFIAAFFINTPIGYAAGILPSFWVGKLAYENNLIFVLPCLFVCSIWIGGLYRKFSNKILG